MACRSILPIGSLTRCLIWIEEKNDREKLAPVKCVGENGDQSMVKPVKTDAASIKDPAWALPDAKCGRMY